MARIIPRASALGDYTAPVENAVARTVAGRLADMVSVKDFGAKGDGTIDDSAAFQAAVDTGRGVYVPAGIYRIVSSLKIRPGIPFVLVGEASHTFQMYARPLLAYDPGEALTDEPMICRERGWLDKDRLYTFTHTTGESTAGSSSLLLSNLHLRAAGKFGSCVETHLMNGTRVTNCWFEARFRGLTLGPQSYDTLVRDCRFSSYGMFESWDYTDPNDFEAVTERGWGLYSSGHATISSVDVTGFGCGVRLTARGNELHGGRFEVNIYAIIIGGGRINYDQGTTGWQNVWTSSANHISGLSFEGNGYGIDVRDARATSVTGCELQGSHYPPESISPQSNSIVGLRIAGAITSRTVQVDGCSFGGAFEQGAIINHSRIPLTRITGSNSRAGKAKWRGQFQPLSKFNDADLQSFHFIGTSLFERATKNRHATATAFHDLMLPGITGLNIKDIAVSGDAQGGPVFAKNLGGVASPTTSATSVSVLFVGEVSNGSVAFNQKPTAGGSGGTIPPGTYYYATTIVAANGESSTFSGSEGSAAVTAGQEVSMTFYGTSVPHKRRIYRGTAPGLYNGYWENAGSGAFTDDGTRAFDGLGEPPKAGVIPSRHEDDAEYQIIATPSWATTVHVSAKATTGFTLNFGTAAPEGATCAWLLFRP